MIHASVIYFIVDNTFQLVPVESGDEEEKYHASELGRVAHSLTSRAKNIYIA